MCQSTTLQGQAGLSQELNPVKATDCETGWAAVGQAFVMNLNLHLKRSTNNSSILLKEICTLEQIYKLPRL